MLFLLAAGRVGTWSCLARRAARSRTAAAPLRRSLSQSQNAAPSSSPSSPSSSSSSLPTPPPSASSGAASLPKLPNGADEDLIRALAQRARFRLVDVDEDSEQRRKGGALVVVLGWAGDVEHADVVSGLYSREPSSREVVTTYVHHHHVLSPVASDSVASAVLEQIDDELILCGDNRPVYFHCASLSGAYAFVSVLEYLRLGPVRSGGMDEGRICGVCFEGGPGVLEPRGLANLVLAMPTSEVPGSAAVESVNAWCVPFVAWWYWWRLNFSRSVPHVRHMEATLLAGIPSTVHQLVVCSADDQFVPAEDAREFVQIQRESGRHVVMAEFQSRAGPVPHLGTLLEPECAETMLEAVDAAERAWLLEPRQ